MSLGCFPHQPRARLLRCTFDSLCANVGNRLQEQKTELESDIKRIKSSIEGGAGELHVLKSQKASLVQRLSNASAALQATLEISKLLPVGLSLDSIGTTSLRLQGMPSPGPSGHSFPIDDVRANPSVIFQPLHPPRPTPSSNSHHLPISHEPILNASSAARSSAAQGALGSLNILSLSSSMHSTTTPSNTTLRSLVHKFQRAEAARVDANVAEVTWYAQMAIEVAPSTRLSYSSTLMSPECVASNVLSGLLCRLEFALAAKLLRLQSASGWPASQGAHSNLQLLRISSEFCICSSGGHLVGSWPAVGW